jgi:hypothetical protein
MIVLAKCLTEGNQMKNKFKIIDASTGIAGSKPLKLKEGGCL